MTTVNVSFGARRNKPRSSKPHDMEAKTAARKAKRDQDAQSGRQSRIAQQANMVGGSGAGAKISLKELKKRVAESQGDSSATPKFSGWA